MKCDEIEPLLINYLNNEILESQKKALDSHLEKCELCRNRLLKLQNLEISLETSDEVSPPDDLADNILSTIPTKEPQISYLSKFLFSLAAISITVIVVLALYHSTKSHFKKQGYRKILFSYTDPKAKAVSIVGDFNRWTKEKLIKTEDNKWIITLKLKPGQYHYSFLINNKLWVVDPTAELNVNDGYGGKNSIIYIKEK